jgi:hypothetical protein
VSPLRRGGAALVLAMAGSLEAQVCDGRPSHGSQPWQAGAAVAGYRYASHVTADVTTGYRGAYARAGLARLRDEELDATVYGFDVLAGGDVAPAPGLTLCPVAGYTALFGPNNYVGRDDDRRTYDAWAGVGVAVPVRAQRFSVTPFARVTYHHLTLKNIPSPSSQQNGAAILTSRATWLEMRGGAGFTLGGVTIRPGISFPFGFPAPTAENGEAVPFGREDGEVSLDLAVVLALRRRP